MIGYVNLGTNDIKRASTFYDELLAEIGAKRVMDLDTFIVWGTSLDQPALSISLAENGKPASVGNGVMVALTAGSEEKVKELYEKAISLGATDEGKPGPRIPDGFYAAYFRDLDGNKLNFFHMALKNA